MLATMTLVALPQVPVSSNDAWMEGARSGEDRFGIVTEHGDLDGDGSIDLVVAAPQPSTGDRVYVFFGPHDLNAEHLEAELADVVIEGVVDSEFGWSLAVGDVVGDASPDLIVAATSEIGRHGRVHVFEGPLTPTTLSTNDAVLSISGLDNGYLGWAVATGDFDGDGKDELAIGATEEGNGNPGAAYLFDADVGSPSDTNDATTRFEGVGLTGAALASAGDMNGDGYEELLIGSYGTLILSGREFGGAVSVVYGRPGFHADYDLEDDPLTTDIAHVIADNNGENLGYDVAPAGDVNVDGFDDFLIGAPAMQCGGLCSNRDRRGGAYIVLGTGDVPEGRGLRGSSRVSAVADVLWDAPVDNDWTGASVAAAGLAGTTYSTWARNPLNPMERQLGAVLLFGTAVDMAYAIPYDEGVRFQLQPKYTCSVDAEGFLHCELSRNDLPPGRHVRRDLGAMKSGGHLFVGDPGSAFGLEVRGPGDLDEDGDNDLMFGAPQQVDFEDEAGDGDAYAFRGR